MYCDIIFSVSEVILNKLNKYKLKSFFINHGLSQEYTNLAKERLSKTALANKKKYKVQIAYVGNLLLKSLDRKVCEKIIEHDPVIDFTFYGASRFLDSNLSGFNDQTKIDFIKLLESLPNVLLKGSTPSMDISK